MPKQSIAPIGGLQQQSKVRLLDSTLYSTTLSSVRCGHDCGSVSNAGRSGAVAVEEVVRGHRFVLVAGDVGLDDLRPGEAELLQTRHRLAVLGLAPLPFFW